MFVGVYEFGGLVETVCFGVFVLRGLLFGLF